MSTLDKEVFSLSHRCVFCKFLIEFVIQNMDSRKILDVRKAVIKSLKAESYWHLPQVLDMQKVFGDHKRTPLHLLVISIVENKLRT